MIRTAMEGATRNQEIRLRQPRAPYRQPCRRNDRPKLAACHASRVLTDTGKMTEITPPQAQWHWADEVSAGVPPIRVWAAGGAHGAGVTGIQGMGVRTPSAAAVAEATVGLDRLVHIPNGGMFTIGMMSVI